MPNLTKSITNADMVRCVQRELALRRAAYPRRVDHKRMTQEKADHELAAMEAILDLLLK
jgi:hypothetical protein